jgi:hypothetical protein
MEPGDGENVGVHEMRVESNKSMDNRMDITDQFFDFHNYGDESPRG